MTYALEMGQVEQDMILSCVLDGRPLPKRIRERPEILLGLEFFYAAFLELSNSRASGFGPSPIALSEILAYAQAHDLDDEMRDDLVYLVRRMDAVYLRFAAERAKVDSKRKRR